MKRGRKFRGSRTHGRGSHKKHRGAGSRGGRGKAGRCKHHFGLYGNFGKHGFFPRGEKEKKRTINVEEVERLAENLDEVDLSEYKVLGKGRVKMSGRKVIKVGEISSLAREKLEKAGFIIHG